ncbi:GMC family oxidoreductase [Kitasatospora atroaurantiaca]|uniref:GMC family oxidoreductase n=1 Tax=Kitasatospora atroaurantiaca TaxID=285545 RepID=UPI00147937D0|nr:GMC oxidoreductase [Kitasatospora atroaurantiaca]
MEEPVVPPTHFDVLIVGAGAAGCVLAARLSEDERVAVGLMEAGPDYGPFDPRRWPAELLNAKSAARGHDWDLTAPSCCARARVVGGSSAHNGCWATIGAAADYDRWAAFSDGAWDYRTLRPYLREAMARLRVRSVPQTDRTAWHQAVIEAAGTVGLPYLEDINGETEREGVGWVPLNAVGSTRWHAAFAYLDPIRSRPNLRIIADSVAAQVEFDGTRATGVLTASAAEGTGRYRRLTADVVVLCCGTYGNPPLLMRSGVGPEPVLRALGVPASHPLAGVGENLVDHSSLRVSLNPLPTLTAAMPDAAESYVAQTVIKARSGQAADEFWDLHIVPAAGPAKDAQGFSTGPLSASLYVFVMTPRSRGRVRAKSLDPSAQPVIEHGFFTDREGHDAQVVLDGVELAHQLAKTDRLTELAGLTPWSDEQREDAAIQQAAGGYWHPVGTCAMGPARDPMAVVDARGLVHGLDNLYVADASVMPVIPRANTHLTTVAVADRLGELLATSLGGTQGNGHRA